MSIEKTLWGSWLKVVLVEYVTTLFNKPELKNSSTQQTMDMEKRKFDDLIWIRDPNENDRRFGLYIGKDNRGYRVFLNMLTLEIEYLSDNEILGLRKYYGYFLRYKD